MPGGNNSRSWMPPESPVRVALEAAQPTKGERVQAPVAPPRCTVGRLLWPIAPRSRWGERMLWRVATPEALPTETCRKAGDGESRRSREKRQGRNKAGVEARAGGHLRNGCVRGGREATSVERALSRVCCLQQVSSPPTDGGKPDKPSGRSGVGGHVEWRPRERREHRAL